MKYIIILLLFFSPQLQAQYTLGVATFESKVLSINTAYYVDSFELTHDSIYRLYTLYKGRRVTYDVGFQPTYVSENYLTYTTKGGITQHFFTRKLFNVCLLLP